MAEKPMLKPSNGDEKMAAQINEIYSKFHMIENLLSDLAPALGKISKDLHPTIRDLREKYERDETVDLIKKVGDNIPTFLQIFEMMKVVKGMMADLMPAVGKIADDAGPVIKDMRERFEREETLALLRKVGDNIPLFVQLFDMLKIAQGAFEDLGPAVGKIAHDVGPAINMLRDKYERDETLELLEKLGDDIPVLTILLELLGKEEVSGMLNKVGGLLPVADRLVDVMNDLNKVGTINTALKMLAYKDVSYLIGGVDKCLVNAMADLKANPVKPGIKNLISAVMDPEVQKGLLILTKFAKYLPKSLSEAMREIG